MDFGIYGEIGHEISGDFCYWLEIRNRKWWVSIGDVMNSAERLWRTIFGVARAFAREVLGGFVSARAFGQNAIILIPAIIQVQGF